MLEKTLTPEDVQEFLGGVGQPIETDELEEVGIRFLFQEYRLLVSVSLSERPRVPSSWLEVEVDDVRFQNELRGLGEVREVAVDAERGPEVRQLRMGVPSNALGLAGYMNFRVLASDAYYPRIE